MLRKDASTHYCLISGEALLILGLTGFFLSDLWGVFQFDLAQTVMHLVGGGLAVSAALSEKETLTRWYAQWSGAVYVLLAIAGFFAPTLWGIGEAIGLHLEPAENIFHLILGGVGLYAGFTPWNLPRWSHA
jgi:hypothetical protein